MASVQSQTKIFSHAVELHARPVAVVARADQQVRDVVGRMAEAKSTYALVVDEDGRLQGIVTEQDIVRRIAFQATGDEAISTLMTSPARAIHADDYLYFAVARMRRFGWRQMPVVDRAGRPAAMVDLADALALAGESVLGQIDRVAQDDTADGLREIKAAQVEIAEGLFADSVPATEIQAILTHINRDIHRRVIEQALEDMAADGWGAPPVGFCAIILGSGGRGESFLYPDQDNGFILEDYPDGRHAQVDPFFIALAERMTHGLDRVGFPLCRGNVMATNPVWRKSLSQWFDQIRLWMAKRNDVTIRLCDIFFDFRPVYGELDLARRLRDYVTEIVAKNPAFLREMHGLEADHRVALGWFGRLVTEKEEGIEGQINLKYRGTLPLVEAARLLALRDRVAETSTLRRLEGLNEKGVVSDDKLDYLTGAFRHVSELLLRQQLADFKAGQPVGNLISEARLSSREKDMLRDGLRAVADLRSRVRTEIGGDVF